MWSSHSPPTQPDLFPFGPCEGESTVIGVDVFKFTLHLSGRFILPVVTANGRITRGSGPRSPRQQQGGWGSPVQTPHVSHDIISAPELISAN